MSTLDKLMSAYRSHFAGRDLPEPSSVNFHIAPDRIDVQPFNTDDVTHLVNLLRWAQALNGVTGRQWRTPGSDSLHIHLSGRTDSGTSVTVYGGIPYPHVDGLVRLAPGETESVTPDEVYLLADLLQQDAA
ncbi:hypothetical protein [Kutzneria kofuensis]|uniref:Uncharacterized protein n=1 Tax=Kutzneria kofuensis TaxID=103725 RepID=A0A7W9NHU8_9PSEU|nr:hypothetical protein [Kutzneria kofuensis]MBB5893180.1 hypothetical protein [Kutzneria kofuensis]